MTPVTAPVNTHVSRCMAFLKGEPKALGTVQIIIGIMMFLFGIILTTFALTPGTASGITLWGGLIIISSGSLTVAAANRYNSCVVISSGSQSVAAANHYGSCLVKASFIMNLISAVVTGMTLILFPVDMITGSSFMRWCHYDSYYRCDHSSLHMWEGIYGVLFVFSLLEFIISICTSAFACSATCCSQATPMYSQPMYSQPMYSQPMYSQPMYSQPMNPPLMNPPTMNPASMNPPMLNPSLMNQPPMYNPAFSDPQEP